MVRMVLPVVAAVGATLVLATVVQVSLRKVTTVVRDTRLRAQEVVEVLAQ